MIIINKLNMNNSRIHPTAEIIQNGVINKHKFTFNHMSILDYPGYLILTFFQLHIRM